jgi:hypothetical protein
MMSIFMAMTRRADLLIGAVGRLACLGYLGRFDAELVLGGPGEPFAGIPLS